MTTPRRFARDMDSFDRKARENMDNAFRKIGLEMFSRAIYRTPVDTGRARGNWQTGINAAPAGVIQRTDGGATANAAGVGSGSFAVNEAGRTLGNAKFGDTLWLQNNVPYIRRLEYGHSKQQAPRGMVRVTVREFKPVARAIGRAIGRGRQ